MLKVYIDEHLLFENSLDRETIYEYIELASGMSRQASRLRAYSPNPSRFFIYRPNSGLTNAYLLR